MEIPKRPQLILDIDDAKRILSDQERAALVSVRTWNEHIGKNSGYNYIAPAGRIAGDVWGNCRATSTRSRAESLFRYHSSASHIATRIWRIACDFAEDKFSGTIELGRQSSERALRRLQVPTVACAPRTPSGKSERVALRGGEVAGGG
jgi:hypothetical protein